MITINKQEAYQTRTNAKFELLSKLQQYLSAHITLSETSSVLLQEWIETIKISIENHDKDMSVCTQPHQPFQDSLTENEKYAYDQLVDQNFIQIIENSPYDTLSYRNLWNDSLIRASESILPASLLHEPTDAMKQSHQKCPKLLPRI